jgi:replicative DNA helicase Mcm
MDIDTFNDLERLPVILFENDTKSITVGERVIVEGDMHIERSNHKHKSYPCVYSRSIEYESKHDIILTERNIEAIKRFTHLKGNKIIDELVKMFATFVIGYEHVKLGLLFSAVSSGNDLKQTKQNRQRIRLSALLVGEPGNAKSVLLRAATKLVPNSRYENCQSSSVRSLTAIVIKEDGEKEFVRLGPVSLAGGAICALNELGRMPFEDQAHLFDIMEEGEFGINKYGLNSKISSPTVIIASANPNSTYWRDSEKVSIDEFPISKVLLDRFDLIFLIRTTRNENAIREYAYHKSELIDENKPIPNYDLYLQKHIMLSKQLNPTLSKEAKMMLAEYYIKIAKRSGSPRVLETLYRIAKAIARLKIKDVVDAEDAKETMRFYNVMLQQLDQVVAVTSDPRTVAFNECLNVLENYRNPIPYVELVRFASRKNEYVGLYIGNKYRLQENKKLRSIADMLLNHSSVRCIKQKPLLLQWSEEKRNNSEEQMTNNYSNNTSR